MRRGVIGSLLLHALAIGAAILLWQPALQLEPLILPIALIRDRGAIEQNGGSQGDGSPQAASAASPPSAMHTASHPNRTPATVTTARHKPPPVRITTARTLHDAGSPRLAHLAPTPAPPTPLPPAASPKPAPSAETTPVKSDSATPDGSPQGIENGTGGSSGETSGTGTSTGTGYGAGGSGSGNGPGDDYLDQIRRRVKRHLVNPPETEEHSGIVDLTIAPDGTLLDARIEQSSGDAALDAAIRQAAHDASPLPPWPPTYQAPRMIVVLPFNNHLGFFDRAFR